LGPFDRLAERSQDWLAQALRDLESARWQAQGGFFEWACFAAQQAAEKALKAVYQKLGAEARGPSVIGLLAGLRERVRVDETLFECARLLDRFYIPTRYPNGWPAGSPKDFYTEKDAADAIRCAEELVRFGNGLLAGPG